MPFCALKLIAIESFSAAREIRGNKILLKRTKIPLAPSCHHPNPKKASSLCYSRSAYLFHPIVMLGETKRLMMASSSLSLAKVIEGRPNFQFVYFSFLSPSSLYSGLTLSSSNIYCVKNYMSELAGNKKKKKYNNKKVKAEALENLLSILK